jgi:hypothetical protein
VSIEERILNIDLENAYYCGKELRAIAFEVRKLEDRIKQLMEAGDRMDLYAAPHDSDKWNEAKEAKL